MSSGNRTVKYENLLKSLRKHYKPLADPPERTVLEHLLYACCLEDARVEQADEGFAKLQQTYFDWNEVRVTTVVELAEALKPLPFPMQAASRIKQCLQSIFETRYQYDIDDMKKANLGKASAELEAWKGMSPFVISYVSQHALGGHSIPASHLICEAMWQCDVLTIAEIPKKALPGVERAIPKNKGVEFAGLVHQFASDLYHHPRSAAPLAVLKEMGATYKSKPKSEEETPVAKGKGASGKDASGKDSSSKSTAASEGHPKKSPEPVAVKPTASVSVPAKPSSTLSGSGKAKEEAKSQKAPEPAKQAEVSKANPAKSGSAKPVLPVKEIKSKEAKASEKPVAKPAASKGVPSKSNPPIRLDKFAKDKFAKDKFAKDKFAKDKSEKGNAEKPKVKSDKGQSDKGQSDKGKSDKSKTDKGKSEKAKSDKSKPVKKDDKSSGKTGKLPVKGAQGSVGSNLTKKKPK